MVTKLKVAVVKMYPTIPTQFLLRLGKSIKFCQYTALLSKNAVQVTAKCDMWSESWLRSAVEEAETVKASPRRQWGYFRTRV